MVKVHFNNIREKILDELKKAENEIVIAVYWFTNDQLYQRLLSKLEEGLRIELIIHNDYINNRDSGLNFQSFIDKGGHFYFSNILNPMHNKFCVIDRKVLINGSYNWTYYAEDRNRENILLIREETETINAFIEEFERLKSLTEKVETIRQLTRFEVDEYNLLRARDYLANDIVYQAKETGQKDLVENAFQIAPDNIEVQKTAFELDLTKKWRLKHSIGSSLKHNKYLIIVPKESMIPISQNSIVQTSEDNQTSLKSDILYGENPYANRNKKFSEMYMARLPSRPIGEVKIKYSFTIDIYGTLKMEFLCLNNGRRQIVTKKITGLIEEVNDIKQSSNLL